VRTARELMRGTLAGQPAPYATRRSARACAAVIGTTTQVTRACPTATTRPTLTTTVTTTTVAGARGLPCDLPGPWRGEMKVIRSLFEKVISVENLYRASL